MVGGGKVNLGFKVTNLNSIPRETALCKAVLKVDAGNIRAFSHLWSIAKFGKMIDVAQAM